MQFNILVQIYSWYIVCTNYCVYPPCMLACSIIGTCTIMIWFHLDAKINGHVFLSLNESRLTQFGISLGFKFAIVNIIEDMVWRSLWCSITSACTCYLQKSSLRLQLPDRLSLQQQSPSSNLATPRTTQHQLNSSTSGQQTKLGKQSHHAYTLDNIVAH